MADSTHTQPGAWRTRPLSTLLVSLVALALVCCSNPTPAHADGDPASDVLVSQSLFLPGDAGSTLRQQSELAQLLSAARRSGYQLRVAVIASPADLGSVTELWRRPASYASFLGQELSLVFRGTLLVVMPDGFGLYGPGAGAPAQRAALAGVGTGGAAGGGATGDGAPTIGATAISAVQRLAASAGHPLRVSAIVTRSAPGSTDIAGLITLALGAVLIALAWAASLRARPLRSPRPGQV